MSRRFYVGLGICAVLFAVFAYATYPAKADECSTNTPLSLWGQNGSNGIVNNDGVPGPFSDDGVTDLQCSMGIAGQKQIADYMARYPNKFVARWKCRRVDNFARV